MTVVLATSLVIALYDADAPEHDAAAAWVLEADEDLVTTPLAVAEMDAAVRREGGAAASERLWHDLDVGAFGVRWWADALTETLGIVRRHPFLGLVDASLVALAGRLRTDRIATFDQHFRSITTLDGEPFVVLPADA